VRDVAFDEVLSGYRRTHTSLLDVARKTNAARFNEVRGAANSIGFNLWHVARWDDSLFPGLAQQVPALASKLAPPEQVWTRGGLAKAWGMPEQLGGGGAGTGLPRDDAQGLRLPGPEVVIAYAAEVFDEFSRTLDRLEPAMLALEASPGRRAHASSITGSTPRGTSGWWKRFAACWARAGPREASRGAAPR
jgi:hypothetical protein